jgi:hypothetical protein
VKRTAKGNITMTTTIQGSLVLTTARKSGANDNKKPAGKPDVRKRGGAY